MFEVTFELRTKEARKAFIEFAEAGVDALLDKDGITEKERELVVKARNLVARIRVSDTGAYDIDNLLHGEREDVPVFDRSNGYAASEDSEYSYGMRCGEFQVWHKESGTVMAFSSSPTLLRRYIREVLHAYN